MPPMHRGYSAGSGPVNTGRDWFTIIVLAAFYGAIAALPGLVGAVTLGPIGAVIAFVGALLIMNWLGAFK